MKTTRAEDGVRQRQSRAKRLRAAWLLVVSLLLVNFGCSLPATTKDSSSSEKKSEGHMEKLAAKLSQEGGGEPQTADGASVAAQKDQQSTARDPINRKDTDVFLLGKEALFASYLLGGLEPEPVPKGEEERVLRAVFGKDAPEGKVRGKAESAGDGITAPDRNETVYLVLPEPPAAIDPQAGRGGVLAVFEGNRLTHKIAAPEGYTALVRDLDVDGDGVRELLLQGSFYNMGELTISAQLINLRGGKVNVVHDFGVVYENPCDGRPDGEARAAILKAEYAEGPEEEGRRALKQQGGPRRPIRFGADYYRAACKELKKAEEAGDPRSAFRPAPKIKKIGP